ncbi:hypothetical protein [Ruegeria sp. HKCCD7318]|uniref:hypothetical protein n=1 Tax=Ruegeria sp. HKCCD7318 TaxID=2683014 RepID=UPI00209C9756|nr:hypothetical protein [Ruegeria sp. HKCCD7318]
MWDINFRGKSLLFQNPDLDGLPFEDIQPSDLPTRSPQFGFPLWGGEKTWIAPDTSWANGAPFSALDSGPYQVRSKSDTHIKLVSTICPISNLSVSRRITLSSNDRWSIEHSVTNHGTHPRPTGIWSVMMLDTPAKIGVDTGAAQASTVFGNPDEMVTSDQTCVVSDCSRLQEFKVGLPNPDGNSLIRCGENGPWIGCSVTPPQKSDQYAHQHPFEVFNSGDYAYCEAEWHSPLCNLGSGETMSFKQAFRVWTNDEVFNAQKKQSENKELLSCMS